MIQFRHELKKISENESLPRDIKDAFLASKVLKVLINECLGLFNQPQLENSVVDLDNQSPDSEIKNLIMDLGVALKPWIC